MNAHDLFVEAARRGLRLEPAGDKLAVIPKGKCPPDFINVLRAHKGELIDWLESRASHLPPDCAPWLHVARQILAGEFDGCDDSTRASLTIGLRGIRNPACARAMEHLKSNIRTRNQP